MHPRVLANLNGVWDIPDNLDVSDFDFSWKPERYDPPFIHQFGTQWQIDGGPKYIVEGAKDIKYHDCQKARAIPDLSKWKLNYSDIDLGSFDWSWHPPECESYTQVFGCEYYSAEKMPCVEYIGKTDQKKYRNELKIKFHLTKQIDVVFMSNGEVDETVNYEKLCQASKRQVKWVRGINGRENAIRRCAEISDTEWVLVFPAKISVSTDFDFNWQPCRVGPPKHYIFYAQNPVNDLCYGHMAPVAYNCNIVKNTQQYNLDFTMSGAHDIVPVSAGVAHFNKTPLMTWRTAFREVIKLKYSAAHGDMEALQRLNVWLTIATGDHSGWCLQGGNDAITYYHQVNGELEKLKQSFHWHWLDQHAQQLGYNFNIV